MHKRIEDAMKEGYAVYKTGSGKSGSRRFNEDDLRNIPWELDCPRSNAGRDR